MNQEHKLSLAMTWVLFRGAAAAASRVIVAKSTEGGAHRHTLWRRGPASVPVVAGGRVSVIGGDRGTRGRLLVCEGPFDIFVRVATYP